MIWTISFFASVVVLLAGVLYSVIAARRYRSDRFFTSMRSLFVAAFIAVFLSIVPIFREDTAGEFAANVKLFFYDFLETIQIFTINADANELFEAASSSGVPISSVYSIYLSMLFVFAQVMTFGFIFSLFKNFITRLNFLIHFRSDTYVFSKLNEQSLLLAKSIRRNHPKAMLIFTDVDKDEGDIISEQVEAAKELKALILRKDIIASDFMRHSKKAELLFFTIGESEEENVTLALKLLEKYGRRENTDLYVFSSNTESEILLANAEKGLVKVRRVNEIRSLIYRFLYDEGHILFENAARIGEQEKKISAVVVGLGKYGTEMVKALSWYCQMDGYTVSIDVYDWDELAEEKFAAKCPDLMAGSGEGADVDRDGKCDIRIHSGIDVRTRAFIESLEKLKDITFVFVSLGDDDNNIDRAANIRMLCERMHIKPVIDTILYSSEINDVFANAKNYRGQAYEIGSIGTPESFYSEEILIGTELEKLALARHMRWGREEEFWQYEYNYRSSMAVAVHVKARQACGIAGADVEEDALTPEQRDIIERLEHRRWSVYMRSEGYVYSGSPEKSSRNDLGKMHHDLVGFAALTEEEKRKDSRVGAK